MPDTVILWDGSVGPPPPEPQIASSLAERRAACVADLQLISEIIQRLVRNCNAAGVEQLLGMIGKPDVRRSVFSLNAAGRRKLARSLRKHEGVEIDPKLLTEEGWEILVDALVHRRQLLFWLARYCNVFELR
jgi:hypothetical protein